MVVLTMYSRGNAQVYPWNPISNFKVENLNTTIFFSIFYCLNTAQATQNQYNKHQFS